MAEIRIEDVIQHLDFSMKRALEAAVIDVLPGVQVDRNRLFKSFVKQVRRKCSTWEDVPDDFINH